MEWLVWIAIVIVIAALLWWLFTRGSAPGEVPLPEEPLGHAPASLSHGPSDAAGQAPPATADKPFRTAAGADRAAGPARTEEEPEPIDGWTESAAENAHYDPDVEDMYIEDLAAEDRGKARPYDEDEAEWKAHTGEAIIEPKAGRAEDEDRGERAG
ncbi:hypothetical protein D477_010109 [Arthrobacter crystallopoietes BAB-32]|uniref:Uncharacterized protein n=1 Tax=Arthrobacter crystallopoietes BAB-32 TaxID=1246476 RepID=N1V2R5_9MICC|nr:hypothetical protein [Arthrobacter crystallopoietes]EMY34342.1 hypothetical protein D477_010109 [Arthrobacter crystallopoietes BAB-32]